MSRFASEEPAKTNPPIETTIVSSEAAKCTAESARLVVSNASRRLRKKGAFETRILRKPQGDTRFTETGSGTQMKTRYSFRDRDGERQGTKVLTRTTRGARGLSCVLVLRTAQDHGDWLKKCKQDGACFPTQPPPHPPLCHSGSGRARAAMALQPMTTLVADNERYLRSFQLFLQRSSEHQCMQDFIHSTLPDILASVGDGKAKLNVIGVGSGAGEIDLEMFSQLRQKYPSITVDTHVVEPSSQQIHNYKVLVSKRNDLDYIKFTWNKVTASEFEQQWKENKMSKKADFIHMIQMLYYVKDPDATVSFFQSLLHKTGKLLIILVSGTSGWAKLWGTYGSQLGVSDITQCVTTAHIKSLLDSKAVGYRSYELPSQMDISECFVEGSEEGGLLLDFLTEVQNFSQTAPAELKAGVLELLRHPDCSVEAQGRVIFNNNLEALVLDPLP
ncbi:Histamine N-methyltransferase [Merluccius polli]|uniref:Histamine N-methyltransferase n=1 Tax=Merluccius polli TaxID=89951 RepID=A0AA47P0S0_MERPO|nr:Histamine N-methyltransferase [Merluccius polli]